MTNNALAPHVAKINVEAFFTKNKTKILDALPQGFEPERFLALLLNEMRRVPDLQKCTKASLFGCMIKATQLGLEPGTGQIFLNPRKNNKKGIIEAEFQIGYPGYLALAYRSEKIDYIDAMVVKEKDVFDIDIAKGLYSHKPYLGIDAGKVICAYAMIHFVNGNKLIKLCSLERIQKAMESSSNKTEYGPWRKHYESMCQKTAIINMLKYSQLTTELSHINEIEHNPTYDIGEELGFIDTDTGEVLEAPKEQRSQLDEMAEGM
jgi:recombination protein RecT